MLEIEYEKAFIYNKIKESEQALLFILPCQDIKGEAVLAQTKALELESPIINVGLVLAEALAKGYSKKYLNQEVIEFLESLILRTTTKNPKGEKGLVVLYNIGILWEKDLSLKVAFLVKHFLKQTSLLLVWSGLIESVKNQLFLLDRNSLYYTQFDEIPIYICKE